MSDFGIRFNTSAGYRQIDTRHIVPQLIGRIDLAGHAYADYGEDDGTQPGWIRREYQFEIPAAIYTRPHLTFHSIPASGQEAYSNGVSVMYKPGATFAAPVLYFFALDYVTRSSASWGIRVMRPDKSVTYDSGNDHLNLSFIYGGVNLNVSHDNASHASSAVVTNIGAPPKGMPGAPAICPQGFSWYAEWGVRFDGIGEERCGMYYRSYGGSLQAVMLRNDYSFDDSSPPNISYKRTYSSNPNNLTIFLLDHYIYD